jgi:hypothetical protein
MQAAAKASGYPGATGGCTGTAILWFIGGVVVGAAVTVVFINLTGEKTFTGLARKTFGYAKSGVNLGKSSWGGL